MDPTNTLRARQVWMKMEKDSLYVRQNRDRIQIGIGASDIVNSAAHLRRL